MPKRLGRGRGNNHSSRNSTKGSFDPEAAHVQHTKIGVWDLYEEKNPKTAQVPGAKRLENRLEVLYEGLGSLPYVWRMVKDILSIKGCIPLLLLYVLVEILGSLMPAISLWYSGQLLNIVQTAITDRLVDKQLLVEVSIARVISSLVERFLGYASRRLSRPLNLRIRQFYSIHVFHAMARLDLPTFDDPAVQRQIEGAISPSGRSSIAWDTVKLAIKLSTTVIELVSQISVLLGVLQGQQDGILLASLGFSQSIFAWLGRTTWSGLGGAWAATTTNKDYIRSQGFKMVVNNPEHRKEVVAGSMTEHLTNEFLKSADRLPEDAGDFHSTLATKKAQEINWFSILQEPLRQLPQIVFSLRAVQYPLTIPLSLASLNLIQAASTGFTQHLTALIDETGSIADQLASVRRLYEVNNIPNQIVDGKVPFPEDQQALALGISVEFQNVSFRYPGSEAYALRNVSFKIERGRLCVIVGANGSGKSTILKLIARLYDPEEGVILLDGKDLKTLVIADLRKALCVLFQDYTHFPLSIRENIGLGLPERADDEDLIQAAAKLGGATDFINRLPDGFDTYLERPVRDFYSGIPAGTQTLFGRTVDYSRLRGASGMSTGSTSLSGGQLQRLAVSRTFMRSLRSEPSVGMLLFDEPSASLDPTAEHDLFERLRNLRGNKTMIFSSHRFGNLTRHADLILYMNDSLVVEAGTHSELVKRQGEYARIWNLQAQAFL